MQLRTNREFLIAYGHEVFLITPEPQHLSTFPEFARFFCQTGEADSDAPNICFELDATETEKFACLIGLEGGECRCVRKGIIRLVPPTHQKNGESGLAKEMTLTHDGESTKHTDKPVDMANKEEKANKPDDKENKDGENDATLAENHNTESESGTSRRKKKS